MIHRAPARVPERFTGRSFHAHVQESSDSDVCTCLRRGDFGGRQPLFRSADPKHQGALRRGNRRLPAGARNGSIQGSRLALERRHSMMRPESLRHPGILAALGAAVLFGVGTPLAKWLLADVSPWLLAGLLYAGSGVGLTLYRRLRRAPAGRLPAHNRPWLCGAILAGGIVGPVLLMFGLAGMPASGASLLLNAEGVFTALLAWFAFRENFDRRIALGMVAIVAGAIVLSWPGEARFGASWSALAALAACLAWANHNNLTRQIPVAEESLLALVKGLSPLPDHAKHLLLL